MADEIIQVQNPGATCPNPWSKKTAERCLQAISQTPFNKNQSLWEGKKWVGSRPALQSFRTVFVVGVKLLVTSGQGHARPLTPKH